MPPEHAAHGHGVPELRGVAAHVGVRERRLRPAHRQGAPRARSASAWRACWTRSGSRASSAAIPASCRAASSSAWRWPARWSSSPSILLLDEPLSNLDAKLRERMRIEIKTLQRRTGITFIYVTHDQAEAMALSDRIVVFNKGAVQQVGTPREVYERPANLFVADFMGLVNKLPGTLIVARQGNARACGSAQQTIDAQLSERLDTARRPVTVAIRPEAIRLGNDDPAVPATIVCAAPSSEARSSATSSTTRSTSAACLLRVQGDRRQTYAPGSRGRADRCPSQSASPCEATPD